MNVSVALYLALIFGAGVRWFMVAADRRRMEYVIAAAFASRILTGAAETFASWLSYLRPLKYDLYVFRIDRLFGEPSFYLGRLVERNLALHALSAISYGILSMVIVWVLIAYLYLRPSDTWLLLTCFVVNLFLAVPIYLLCPVSGPLFAFSTFPALPTLGAAHLIAIKAAPNGIPSVHMSSALLILWFLRHWLAGRLLGGLFVGLTAFATLSSGQHYLFDLFCALPYTAAVIWFSAWLLDFAAPRMRMAPVEVLSEESPN